MSFDFLQRYGAKRMRDFDPQPLLIGEVAALAPNEDEKIGLGYEIRPADWEPQPLVELDDCKCEGPHCPKRFVDGKDVGRTVAWLKSSEGFPVPVRLSEIGAVALRAMENDDGACVLRREWHKVERVVTLVADLFPTEEVETFAAALGEHGFRLLPCAIPGPQRGGESENNGENGNAHLFDFERMRRATQNRSSYEMLLFERQALGCEDNAPTLVDGRLEQRAGAFDTALDPVLGLVKSHEKNYLHPQGWRTFYDLEPGQRTPAFCLEGHSLSVVTWYLRLDGARGELPNWGVVRVEVTRRFFEEAMEGDWTFLDRVSRLICDYRCRDENYGRAAVSIHPIQRAEESLGALFTRSETLVSRFYHLAGM